MSRITFENLPSTNTPVNAENLNKLNNVVISPTEPTTGEEVWIKKSNNIWDNSQIETYSDFVVANGTGIKVLKTATGRTTPQYKINLKADTTYCISYKFVEHTTTEEILYCLWYTEDGTQLWAPNLSGSQVLFTPTVNIVGVQFYLQSTETDGVYVEIEDLQIELGETATDYEEYVDKEIYVKNDNGVYELFNKVEEPQYCVVQTSGNRILTFGSAQYSEAEVPFDKIVTKNGDFSLNNNHIKIGKNISKIRLTFNLMINAVTNQAMFTISVVSGGSKKHFSFSKVISYESISYTCILDVKEDDEIYLLFQHQNASENQIIIYGTSNFCTTSMIVEKIG